MRALVAASALALVAAALLHVNAMPLHRLRRADRAVSAVATEADASVGIHCWTDPPTLSDLKEEFRQAQRDAQPGFQGHVRGKGLTDTHGSIDDQPRLLAWFAKLDAYSAAVRATQAHAGAGEVNDHEQVQLALELFTPWSLGERYRAHVTKNVRKFPLFQKQQVVVQQGVATPIVDPFDHIADVLKSHHLHSGSTNGDQRHALLVQTLQSLRTCLQLRIRQYLDSVRDSPATHLLNGGASFKASGLTAAATVLRPAGGHDACGNLPVKEYTGGLSDPEFESFELGGALRLSARLSGGHADATHTWALVPYAENTCWFTLVPNTAKVWVTPTLSGCHIFVADDGNGNLLVMHTNANRIGIADAQHRDANIRAKLDCIQHALAAHPTYAPAAQLTPGMYLPVWGRGGTPFGINTTPGHAGGWQFYYSVPTHRGTAAARTTSAVVNQWPACGGGGHLCVFKGDAVGTTHGPSHVNEERTSASAPICKTNGLHPLDDGTW